MSAKTGVKSFKFTYWGIILALAIHVIIFAPTSAMAEDDTQNKILASQRQAIYEWCGSGAVAPGEVANRDLVPYKPNYIFYQWGTPYPEYGQQNNTRFQFSFKQYVCANFYVAYTQRSFWETSAPSLPFRDHNFNPEVFLDLSHYYVDLDSTRLSLGRIGLIEHESNGRDGDASRSWNRSYIEPAIYLDKPFFWDKAVITLKLWKAYIIDKENNGDILKYYGDGELKAVFERGIAQLAMTARKGHKEPYGNLLTELFFDVGWQQLRVYLQYFDGYGENLLNYKDRSTRYGIGFSFSEYRTDKPERKQ